MMMLILKVLFAFNLYCSLRSCDYPFRGPEISVLSRADEVVFEELPDPTVKTALGPIEGFKMKSSNGRTISAFEGIRFALPPVGNLRFRSPVPSGPWRGVLEAKKPSEYCTQLHLVKMLRVIGQEDCLFLNVYVPEHLSSLEEIGSKYPVIIYFHGGSFLFGSGFEYGPSYLLDRDLIFVTVNFRMGILGFFSTEDYESVGNYGLKDQTLAMKWVYDHIESFGGDKTRITIMGQSAGATSVHLHLISNTSRPYFSGGVSLSGSAFLNWGVSLKGRALQNARRLAELVKCPDLEDTRALVQCFRETHSYTLVGLQLSLFEWLPWPPVAFGPVLELPHPEAFLTQSPDQLYAEDKVAKYPWIASLMENEGQSGIYVMKLLGMLGRLRRNPAKYLPMYLDYKYMRVNQAELTRRISEFYLKNESIHQAPIQNFVDMQSDRYFVYGIEKALKAHSQSAPTYAYIFSYISQYNMGHMLGQLQPEIEVGHGEDMFFYFNASIYSHGFRKSDPEYLLSQVMINLLNNFAQKREPLYSNSGSSEVKIWDPIESPSRIRFLNIGKDIKMIEDPFVERFKFWENLDLPDFKPLRPRISKFYNQIVNNHVN